jgi:6-phosphogluconate dehydrogenase
VAGEVRMKIGFVGLGRMGASMVERLIQHGEEVVAFDLSAEARERVAGKGAGTAGDLGELVKRLEPPRAVWVMVPSGEPTGKTIEALAALLEKGDTVIDGGNSNFKDSMKRALELERKGIFMLDAGTSGGIWGLEVGYCLMVGGDPGAFARVEALFKALAPEDGYLHVGKSGAGHFVKMIHNGIEYALLQAYAEGFEIMEAREDFGLDLGKIAHLWNQGSVVRSWLLELAERAFADDPHLKTIKDFVEDSGEGRWSVATAIEENVPAPVITISLLERLRSRQEESFSAKVIAALRNQFGGHAVKRE